MSQSGTAVSELRDMISEGLNGDDGFTTIEVGTNQFALIHYEGSDVWIVTVEPAEIVAAAGPRQSGGTT